jgi:hypothetical protein
MMTHSHTLNIRLFILATAALFAASHAQAQTTASDAAAPVVSAPAAPAPTTGASIPTAEDISKIAPASGVANPAATLPAEPNATPADPKSKKRKSANPK